MGSYYEPFPLPTTWEHQSVSCMKQISQQLRALHNFILFSLMRMKIKRSLFFDIGKLPKHLYAHTLQCETTLGYSPVKACYISVSGTTDLKPIPCEKY